MLEYISVVLFYHHSGPGPKCPAPWTGMTGIKPHRTGPVWSIILGSEDPDKQTKIFLYLKSPGNVLIRFRTSGVFIFCVSLNFIIFYSLQSRKINHLPSKCFVLGGSDPNRRAWLGQDAEVRGHRKLQTDWDTNRKWHQPNGSAGMGLDPDRTRTNWGNTRGKIQKYETRSCLKLSGSRTRGSGRVTGSEPNCVVTVLVIWLLLLWNSQSTDVC